MPKRFNSYDALCAALLQRVSLGSLETISFDVFDTLVHRRMSPDLVVDGVSLYLSKELARHGLIRSAKELRQLRHDSYMDLVKPHIEAGLDPDTTLDELAFTWVSRAAGAQLKDSDLTGIAGQLAATELTYELQAIYPNLWLKKLLPELRHRGVRVIAISDMYLGETRVRRILEQGGLLEWVDSLFVSGDLKLLKRTGRLFSHVRDQLGLTTDRWLHVGDNLWADGIQATRQSITAWIINDKAIHREARRQVFDRGELDSNPEWAGMVAASYALPTPGAELCAEEIFGNRVLGPIFTSFIHGVLERCRADGIERVFFLAREGQLLKTLYEQLAPLVFPEGDEPVAVYFCVSRLTAMLAAMRGYGMRELDAALANTSTATMRTLLAPLCLDEGFLIELAQRNGIRDLDATLPTAPLSFPPFQRVLDDPALKRLIEALSEDSSDLINAYLDQSGFFDHQRIAIVDVGWGGQIQDHLHSIIRNREIRPQVFGYYLGANHRASLRDYPDSRMEGIVTDFRRPDWSGFAAFEFVFAFEIAARAPHGTTIAYRRQEDGGVYPVFREADSPSRIAEAIDDPFIALLQTGIVDYAKRYRECATMLGFEASATLPFARLMLERCVRYPDAPETSWWARLNNVADLGSTKIETLGIVAGAARWWRVRSLLQTTHFRYGTARMLAGLPGQIAIAAISGLRVWRNFPRLRRLPMGDLPMTSKIIGRMPRQSYEIEIEQRCSLNLAAARASRTGIVVSAKPALRLTELLPIRLGYLIARGIAWLSHIDLPSQPAPHLGTLIRRETFARLNLRNRIDASKLFLAHLCSLARGKVPVVKDRSSEYRLGHDVLGPIFAAFAHLLLLAAANDGLKRLAFVSRDGAFLREVTEKMRSRIAPSSHIALDYVHLSRISTALPQQELFGTTAFDETIFIRAGILDVTTFLGYYGLDPDDFSIELNHHGLTSNTPLDSIEIARPLLNDPRFLEKVEMERQRQRGLLGDYLRQQGILGDEHCAMVDIGWRGSILSALTKTFSREPDYRPLRSYFLGYWHELGCHRMDGLEFQGLLADCRIQRNLIEGAAYYLAQLLEAICRADHGTVLGYQRDSVGLITPVLADASVQRQAEVAGEERREPIRRGIMDFVDSYAKRCGAEPIDPKSIRQEAQRQLFRLAFFPRQGEIEAVAGLVHTEGHAENWSRPLIDPVRPSPIFSPRLWLAGLASPWRAGYVMVTGGYPLAWGYVGLESLLLALPPSVRASLRKIALTLAQRS